MERKQAQDVVDSGGETMKKKVLLRAPFMSRSGYGEHARQLAKFLIEHPNVELSTQVLPWGNTPWRLDKGAENGLIGDLIARTGYDRNTRFDVSFQVQLPNEWDFNLAECNVGVTAGVETDICNPDWVSKYCNRMDRIIVPSKHAESTVRNSHQVSVPLHVVPECYFDELTQEPNELDLRIDTDFNFLTVGMITGTDSSKDRKNLFNLVKWFSEAFKTNKKVGLIIKASQGRDTALDRIATEKMLKSLLKEIKHGAHPKIHLLHGDMNRNEMRDLYKHPKVKAFVSCTRGEGFGLPFLEAAVAGLPVIATNWSAHAEFLNQGFWIKLDHKLQEVHPSKIDGNIFVKGARWAEVDEKDFKSKITKFYDSNVVPRKKASELSRVLAASHSWDSIRAAYATCLEEVLA
jgi:glycosyltransferase involved in cell wall biosynthesis